MTALLAAVAALPLEGEVGGMVENPSTPAWVIGLVGFGVLAVALIVTLLLNVERKGPF